MELTDDRMIVNAILLRDSKITQQYLYVKCFPLFKSIFDNYYTDCQSCFEFINEIYLHILTPQANTGLCKLQSFQFSSTLATWLKTVAVYYCYAHYRRKSKISFVEERNEKKSSSNDRFDSLTASVYVEPSIMTKDDIMTVLDMMPNKRYSTIIRLRYIEGLSNEEAAATMQMGVNNFYNKHLRAKKQFIEILKKEEQYGEIL